MSFLLIECLLVGRLAVWLTAEHFISKNILRIFHFLTFQNYLKYQKCFSQPRFELLMKSCNKSLHMNKEFSHSSEQHCIHEFIEKFLKVLCWLRLDYGYVSKMKRIAVFYAPFIRLIKCFTHINMVKVLISDFVGKIDRCACSWTCLHSFTRVIIKLENDFLRCVVASTTDLCGEEAAKFERSLVLKMKQPALQLKGCLLAIKCGMKTYSILFLNVLTRRHKCIYKCFLKSIEN
ncbi:hypothetical protein HELRODRAFT_160577 [Helobdella robusta]|uniref:Uncharacterized protein n=1 Tax=Helobdella robusta TaxID=6412 RepID=T1EQF8_HELRO|nr:hypothetical protein HELRODRAFT_160577 [Helobdella robusta]ESO06406.1 hypothetical protein HELRODRAFT_160577 [Helobdella robusta]